MILPVRRRLPEARAVHPVRLIWLVALLLVACQAAPSAVAPAAYMHTPRAGAIPTAMGGATVAVTSNGAAPTTEILPDAQPTSRALPPTLVAPVTVPAAPPALAVVVVANTGGAGVTLRASKVGEPLGVYPDGTRLAVRGAAEEAEGRQWLPVRAPDALQGWVAQDYTISASAEVASSGGADPPTGTGDAISESAGSAAQPAASGDDAAGSTGAAPPAVALAAGTAQAAGVSAAANTAPVTGTAQAAEGSAAALAAASAAQATAEPAVPERRFVVAIDPGHGGSEIGAWHSGLGVVEKEVNLAIALKLAALLEAEGFTAVLTRVSDSGVNVEQADLNGNGSITVDDDLQARVDVANAAGADALVSIHNNGGPHPGVRGTSVWYCADHPQGAAAARLAGLLQQAFLDRLRGMGYDPIDQGANDDVPLGKPYGHLFVVGVQTPRVARELQMPGVVGESLYVTSDAEAALLASDDALTELAAAYRDALVAFLTESPQG